MRAMVLGAVVVMACVSAVRAQESEVGQVSNAELYETPADKKDPEGIVLMPGVTAGVLVEVEASYESQGDDDRSDLRVSTFELGMDADFSDGIAAHVLLLWEEDDTDPMEVDEAFVRLGETERMPAFLQVGRQYLPFGVYISHFVSDPLTLELGEIRETAALAGFANDWIEASVGAFNGEIDEEDGDHVNDLVAAVSVFPLDGVALGLYWLSDMGETDGLQGPLSESMDGTNAVLYEKVAGAGGFVSVEAGFIQISGEYLSALDEFEAGLLGDEKRQPAAWDVECAALIGTSWEIAVRYEGTDECPELPQTQYGAAVSYGLSDHATLAAEYLRGEFDDAEDRDLITGQLAVEF